MTHQGKPPMFLRLAVCIAVLVLSPSSSFAQQKDEEDSKQNYEKSVCDNLISTAKRVRNAACQSPKSDACTKAEDALAKLCGVESECSGWC
jgi:hypothetical protein